MTARLIDVATRAGVSQATASRVLNGKAGVSAETREVVLSAAQALGYARVKAMGRHADTHADVDRYRRLRALRIPLVLVNGCVDGVDAVFLSDDDHTAMSLAVAHLASLGHERIGLAVGPERYVPVIRKVEGFVQAVGGADPLVEH